MAYAFWNSASASSSLPLLAQLLPDVDVPLRGGEAHAARGKYVGRLARVERHRLLVAVQRLVVLPPRLVAATLLQQFVALLVAGGQGCHQQGH